MKYQKLIFIFLFFLLSQLSLFVFAQGTGYFQIQSDPQASIFLDGKVMGKVPDMGSLLLKNVPTGTHELQIVKEGYKVHTKIIEIRPNEIQFHSVVLTPKVGALLIETDPVECTIEIPQLGIVKSKKNEEPLEIPAIPIGNYKISFAASGKKISYNLNIEEGARKHLMVNIMHNEIKEGQPVLTWRKTYSGGIEDEIFARSIIQTTDGGYMIAGYKSGFFEAYGYDTNAWIAKLNSDGNIVWEKTYGGESYDDANSVIQSTDGGYTVAGITKSKGARDAWIIKLDNLGNIIWNKTFGGEKDYRFLNKAAHNLLYKGSESIIETTDGDYVVTGNISSKDSDEESAWILKLDSSGNQIWERIYSRNKYCSAHSILQGTDGGYIVAGYSLGKNEDEVGVWIFKLDSNGNMIWEKIYGKRQLDWASSIIQTIDGGYVVAGFSQPFVKTSDVWIFKLDNQGNIVWEKTYGGDKHDGAFSIIKTTDGGYAIAGYTYSKGVDGHEAWIIKLDNNGNIIWDKAYGGREVQCAYSIIQTTDGGYAIVGTGLNNNTFILKLDSEGNLISD